MSDVACASWCVVMFVVGVCGRDRTWRLESTWTPQRANIEFVLSRARARSCLFAPLDRAFIVLGEGRTFIHFVI